MSGGLPWRVGSRSLIEARVQRLGVAVAGHGGGVVRVERSRSRRPLEAATRTVWPEEAIIGARYELVVTAACGWLRRRLGVHVRVVGSRLRSRETPWRPALSGASRPVRRASRAWLAGAHVTAAVRQAFVLKIPRSSAGRSCGRGGHPRRRLGARSPGVAPTRESLVVDAARGPEIEVEVQGFASPRFIRMPSDRIDRDRAIAAPSTGPARGARIRRPRCVFARHCRCGRTLSREMALDGPVRAN